MRPSKISLGVTVTALLLVCSAGAVSAEPSEPPTYRQARGLTFESVEPGVWKVIDPRAPATGTRESPEWHRGLEVAPDGTVWVWGPGGIRELGGSPIGDDSFDPDEWADLSFPIWSRARRLAIGVDGTVWAIIDSQVRSHDGSAWTTHELDWEAVAPRGTDEIHASMIQALPNGTVWASWEAWYDEGYAVEHILASFDGREWAVQNLAEELRDVSSIASTPDGDVWLVIIDEDSPVLLRRHADEWQRVEPPSTPWSGPAIGPDGTLWMTVTRPTDPGCNALARLAQGTWSSYESEGDEWCVYALLGLEVGPDGTAWFALDGVAAFDGAEWQQHLLGSTPLDLDVAPDGMVWVAGPDGVFVIDP